MRESSKGNLGQTLECKFKKYGFYSREKGTTGDFQGKNVINRKTDQYWYVQWPREKIPSQEATTKRQYKRIGLVIVNIVLINSECKEIAANKKCSQT